MRKTRVALFFFFFFISGFAALLYQIVWLKYLNLIFGSTTYATAAVLSAFFFGLSVGSRLCVKWPILFRSPLRSYGLAEMGVGLFALLFPALYAGFRIPVSWVFNAVGPQTILYNFLTFLLAFVVLAVPTSLMGATLPLLSDVLIGNEKVSERTGLLYGMNTAGAVAGIVVSAFILIPSLGLHATILVGVCLNLLVGVTCFLAGKGEKQSPVFERTKAPADPFLSYYALSGFLAIGYEVLWTRILVLHLGSSVYAYAIMLSIFLLGISFGSYAGGRWVVNRNILPETLFSWIQIAWALSILLQVWQFSRLSDVLFFLATQSGPMDSTRQFLVLFLGTFQALILPTLLSGALFPLMVKKLWSRGVPVKDAAGFSYAYNTVGGIFGSLAAGFLLVPYFGTQKSLLLLASCNLGLGLVASIRFRGWDRRAAALSIPAAIFLCGALLEQNTIHILQSAGTFEMGQKEKLIHIEEDVSATISVEQRSYMGQSYDSLSVNGVNVAGTSPNLVTIQKMQGHIPMILAGPARPKRVLHIGFGSGGTAYAVSLYPDTDITVVELSRGVVRNADRYFGAVNHGVVRSGKLRFIFFDGRSFLQNTKETFDVILSDSVHPRYSGNGSLYTKDYYQLVYARLNPRGVHSQWIPIYSLTLKNLKEILRAFVDVFPDTYVWYVNSTINPYIIVTGTKAPNRGISPEAIFEAISIPGVAADLKEIGVTGPCALLDHFLFGTSQLTPWVQDVDPHTDDRLSVEYESSRVLSRNVSWRINFLSLLTGRVPVTGYLQSGTLDPTVYRRYYDATTLNLRGQAYFLSKNLAEAKKLFAEAHERNPEEWDPYEYYHFRF
jgi:spermidine synthase